jgi:hypothetical protein
MLVAVADAIANLTSGSLGVTSDVATNRPATTMIVAAATSSHFLLINNRRKQRLPINFLHE